MCLIKATLVEKNAEKALRYKVLELSEGFLRSPFYGGYWEIGLEETAWIAESRCYECGFHVCLTLDDAKKFRESLHRMNLKLPSGPCVYVIAEVEVTEKHSEGITFSYDIAIPGETWKKAKVVKVLEI